MTKILIHVSGGTVQNVCSSSQDVRIVIIDYDNIERGDKIEDIEPLEPDAVDENIYSIFTDTSDPQEVEIHDHLKRIKF